MERKPWTEQVSFIFISLGRLCAKKFSRINWLYQLDFSGGKALKNMQR